MTIECVRRVVRVFDNPCGEEVVVSISYRFTRPLLTVRDSVSALQIVKLFKDILNIFRMKFCVCLRLCLEYWTELALPGSYSAFKTSIVQPTERDHSGPKMMPLISTVQTNRGMKSERWEKGRCIVGMMPIFKGKASAEEKIGL